MKKILLIVFLMPTMIFSQSITTPPSGGNQRCKVIQWMGLVQVSFIYNSPDVTGPNGEDRKGKIWGELVHEGFQNLGFGTAEASPWRAGANENTIFETSHDLEINGKKLAAGKYGFFIATDKEGPWTIVFSNNASSWGSYFYNPEEDALRVTSQPEDHQYTEWLSYAFENRKEDQCTAYLAWENKKLPFSIKVPDMHEVYLAKIRNELRSAPGFTWQNWNAAANYCYNNEVNLEEGLQWAENAINAPFIGQENFTTLQTKANLLESLNKTAEAEQTMQQAIAHTSATMQQIHFYGRSLINEGKAEKALEIFEYNKKKHPEDKFTTVVGLARGNAAIGKIKKAIKYWEQALENLPENQKPFLPQYQAEIQRLKDEDA